MVSTTSATSTTSGYTPPPQPRCPKSGTPVDHTAQWRNGPAAPLGVTASGSNGKLALDISGGHFVGSTTYMSITDGGVRRWSDSNGTNIEVHAFLQGTDVATTEPQNPHLDVGVDEDLEFQEHFRVHVCLTSAGPPGTGSSLTHLYSNFTWTS